MPISVVMTQDEVMQHMVKGSHGSTFGGNPLACAVAIESLNVLFDENLIDNSLHMGEYFRESVLSLNHPSIKEVRGRGLLNAIEFHEDKSEKKFAYGMQEA